MALVKFSVLILTISVLLMVMSPRPTTANNICKAICSDKKRFCIRRCYKYPDENPVQDCLNECQRKQTVCNKNCMVTGRLLRREEDLLPESAYDRFYWMKSLPYDKYWTQQTHFEGRVRKNTVSKQWKTMVKSPRMLELSPYHLILRQIKAELNRHICTSMLC